MPKFVRLDFRAITIIIIVLLSACCAPAAIPIVTCIFSFDPHDNSILKVKLYFFNMEGE